MSLPIAARDLGECTLQCAPFRRTSQRALLAANEALRRAEEAERVAVRESASL